MSVEYYNKNAEIFFLNTVNTSMEEQYKCFLQHIPLKSKILDLGCGSGRDSKKIMELGYEVTPFDLSKELGEMAEKYLGKKVIIGDMRELNYINEFQGIWACASLLHIKIEELGEVFKKCYDALTDNGIFYSSFKYGDIDYQKDGRHFTCFTEKRMNEFLKQKFRKSSFEIVSYSLTGDVREGRESEKWLNVVLKKIDTRI